MNLSVTKAWDETAAFVKREAGILFLIVFGLGVLPGLIAQALAGRFVGNIRPAPGMVDVHPLAAAFPILVLIAIPVIVLSLWGNLTVNLLALRRENVVGQAFAHAARRILPLLGATLLLIAASIVVAFLFLVIAGYGTMTGHAGVTVLVFLILFVLAIFFGVRFLVMAPAAAAEPIGPIAIIRRSWQLTAGHFWRLLGFFLLMIVVFLVLLVVVTSVVGILVTMTAGQPQPGSLGSFLLQLITGILQAVWTTYFIVLVARIYVQLSGNIGSVAEVFE
jgi:hypothetical protein